MTDDEWAKFRLLMPDYRTARAVLAELVEECPLSLIPIQHRIKPHKPITV